MSVCLTCHYLPVVITMLNREQKKGEKKLRIHSSVVLTHTLDCSPVLSYYRHLHKVSDTVYLSILTVNIRSGQLGKGF